MTGGAVAACVDSGPEATVFAHRRLRWIFFHGDERDVVEFELEQIDRFLHQIAVLVADVLELLRRNAHVEGAAGDVAVSSGLEPGFEGLAIHLLFKGRQNLYPGVNRRCWRSCK